MSQSTQATLSTIPQGYERPARKDQRIDLLRMFQILMDHLTPSLCQTVYKKHVNKERERKWTFEAIVQFWMAMIIRHPDSLEQGLDETRKRRGRDKFWPPVMAASQAFFEKCQKLRQDFFQTLYEDFTARLLPQAPTLYASWMKDLRRHFTEILVVDGSRLDAVCHRLKILWPVRSALLPGGVTVFYDLFRGLTRHVLFSPNAADSELPRFQQALVWISQGTLLLGDRIYAAVEHFHLLADQQLYGLFRLHRRLKIKRLRVLSQKQGSRGFLEDVLVQVGSGRWQPKITLRLIRFRGHKTSLDLLTNVLDPQKLSAEQAVALYGMRWSIERMFLDLKKTLKLHCLYASHPNLVAQQFYATVMVYNAFRLAQAGIASQTKILPEQISPAKLFPKLAQSSNDWAVSQLTMMGVYRRNPGLPIQEPNWKEMPFTYTRLGSILAQRRNPHRRLRRTCPSQKKWKSFAHVKGGPSLLRSLIDG